MAEFCFKCYQLYFDDKAVKRNLLIDDELCICEGCGRYTNTVVDDRRPSIFYVMRHKDIYKYNLDEDGWEESIREYLEDE